MIDWRAPPPGDVRRRSPNFNSKKVLSTTGCLLSRSGPLGALQEVIHQLGTGVPHLDIERFNAPREIVVHPDRRNSDEQTHGGSYQRFRNTAGHGAEASGLLRRNTLEGVDDSD